MAKFAVVFLPHCTFCRCFFTTRQNFPTKFWYDVAPQQGVAPPAPVEKLVQILWGGRAPVPRQVQILKCALAPTLYSAKAMLVK